MLLWKKKLINTAIFFNMSLLILDKKLDKKERSFTKVVFILVYVNSLEEMSTLCLSYRGPLLFANFELFLICLALFEEENVNTEL